MDLGLLAVEDEEDLIEVRLGVAVDLLLGEHGSCLGATAGIADQRRVIADDEHHRMTVFLEGSEDVEHHKVADVEVGRGGVQAELDPQPLSSLEAGAQMVLDVDLDRAFAQPGEESGAQDATRLLGLSALWSAADSRDWRPEPRKGWHS